MGMVLAVMADEREEPVDQDTTDEGHSAHPVEPAEGPRQPGAGAGATRVPHPDAPAEGERDS